MARRSVNTFKPIYVKLLIEIDKFSNKHGYPPTIRELGRLAGVSSSSTVYSHLKKMAEFGMISFEPGKPRTLTIC